jgi:serine/threonine-protein kinase
MATEPASDRIGPFRILERLASCSGREVFLGVDGAERRAVLTLLGAPHVHPELVEKRVADEAGGYARLSHPNLVKVIDLFSANGRVLIALESVEGTTLNVVRAALARLGQDGDDALWLYVGACVFSGLAAAHSASGADGNPSPIVHRNVNPSTVYVAWDGTIKLGDFSVASVSGVVHDPNPGLTWGSYGYLAPEQVGGQSAGAHTDVYSAMLVLWELLAGRKAIERDSDSSVELLDRMAAPTFPSLDELRPDLDESVREAVRTGLQVDPSKRTIDAAQASEIFRNATRFDEMGEHLARLLDPIRSERPSPPPSGESSAPPAAPPVTGSSAPPAAPPVAAAPPQRRRRGVAIATAVVLGATLGALFSISGTLVSSARVALDRPRTDPWPPASTLATAAAIPQTATTPDTPEQPPPQKAADDSPGPATAADTEDAQPAIPGNEGELDPPPAASGHRIFVDGKVVSEGTDPVRVSCGAHSVRIGSAGRLQTVDVPCGSALALTR